MSHLSNYYRNLKGQVKIFPLVDLSVKGHFYHLGRFVQNFMAICPTVVEIFQTK